jgi:hypothetical protein
MSTKKLSDFNLLSVGHTIQMVGAVYAGDGQLLLCLFPEDRGVIGSDRPIPVTFAPHGSDEEHEVHTLDMDSGDWERFIRQTDMMEAEVLTKASDGTIAKVIKRKCERQIEATISWKCFKRDGYKCRYCANDNVPLTIDHLVTWEEGGPSIEANLLSACKKCNKVRGNLPYAEWLKHPRYLATAKNLDEATLIANEELVATLDRIPRMKNIRTR